MVNHRPKKGAAVTNDELARMIAEGFASVDGRFETVDRHFEALDERFDKTDKRLAGMENRLADVDERLRVVETKLDRALYSEFVHFEMRLKRVEQKVGIR